MRRILLLIPLLTLALTAVMIVNAQNSDDVAAQNITDQLPITEDVRYVAGAGDTLDGIAALFDVSLTCLIETNEITEPNVLFPGDELLIRVACPPYVGGGFVAFPRIAAGVGGGSPAPAGGGGGELVVIEFGDTLDEIAQEFNVALIALLEYNDIENAGGIVPGDVVEIPPFAVPYGVFPPEEGVSVEAGGGSGLIYVVQPGDTLDTIGQTYDAAPLCIARTNNVFEPQRLQVRSTVFISVDCPPYDGITSLPSGRIIPFEGEADVVGEFEAVSTVVATTTRPAVVIDGTAPGPDAPQQTAIPADATAAPTEEQPAVQATPTPEVLDDPAGEAGDIIDTLEDLDVE
jgi:LysM repeat protein